MDVECATNYIYNDKLKQKLCVFSMILVMSKSIFGLNTLLLLIQISFLHASIPMRNFLGSASLSDTEVFDTLSNHKNHAEHLLASTLKQTNSYDQNYDSSTEATLYNISDDFINDKHDEQKEENIISNKQFWINNQLNNDDHPQTISLVNDSLLADDWTGDDDVNNVVQYTNKTLRTADDKSMKQKDKNMLLAAKNMFCFLQPSSSNASSNLVCLSSIHIDDVFFKKEECDGNVCSREIRL